MNVLELFGVSSVSGEPPWFFINPDCQNGSLVIYLKGLRNDEDIDLLRCIHRVADGVLHGHLRVSFHLYLADWSLLRRVMDVGCQRACG